MEDKLRDILASLEEAISYEDWKLVEDVAKEMMFMLDDLESGFGIDDYDDDNF